MVAVIGDFVTAKCWNPDQDEEAEKTIIRQGILAVQDPRTRHRAIIGESGMVYMCVWKDSVEVVPDKSLLGHVLAWVEAWRKMYGKSRRRVVANVISADIGGPAKMTDVPNGRWAGVWTGYEVTAVCGYGKWKFTTDEGVRGIGIGCIVTANHGRITVEVHHPKV